VDDVAQRTRLDDGDPSRIHAIQRHAVPSEKTR
jgi:hypothetical protein